MKINFEESEGSGSKDQKWMVTSCQRDVLAATKSCGVVRPTNSGLCNSYLWDPAA